MIWEHKRILFITHIYPSSTTGGTSKSRQLIECLSRMNGCNIDVCSVKHQHMIMDRLSLPNVLFYTSIKKKQLNNPIKFFLSLFRDLVQIKPFFVSRLYDQTLYKTICKLTQKHTYDVVVLDGYSSLQYAGVLDQKIIYSEVNDMTLLYWNRFIACRNIVKKIFFFIEWCKCLIYEHQYLLHVHAIWSIKESSMLRLQKISKASISIIPITIPSYPYVFRSTSKHIVFSGLLHWQENTDSIRWFLQNCWNSIHDTYPDVRLYITGQLADSSLQKLISRYPNVLYCGHIRTLSKIYEKCACAITPVFIDDGIKIKTLTYIGHGLPVVSGAQAANGLISCDGISLSTKKNFSNAVITVLQNNSYRLSMSKKGYFNAQTNYSAKNLLNFFTHNKGIWSA